MTDLLKEAIADAKAVREVALANAKIALEEAFTPRLQSMLSSKLSEEAEEDEEMTEGEDEEHMEEYMEGEEEEAPKMEEADEEYSEEMEEEYGSDEESMEEGEDSAEEPGDEIHEEEEEEMADEEEEIDEDLMEIIRQLEEELDSSEIGTGDNKQPSKSASDDHTEMKKEKLVQLVNEEEEEEEAKVEEAKDEDEVDIQEILRALREEEEEEEKVEEGEKEEDEMKEAKLAEAYAVIQFLREKLNEVNLLNSKLLFSNKLFRAHALTESQKITVIENFDRAKSLREVKLVYATLAESLKTTKVKQIKESFASKPVASTRPSKAILSESTQMADRLRKLAGLK